VRLLLLTFGFATASAIIPIFNMEAYITIAYARAHDQGAFELAVLGSFGQNIGKLAWFYVSRGALDVPWLRNRLGTPKRQAQFERWRSYVEGRPVMSGALTFVSAAIGFPPFFAMAMVAGTLRMNVVVFFVAGFVGRTLFFWAWLLGVGLVLP
jgi:membrane protein YqaA with SNARE-associated domain